MGDENAWGSGSILALLTDGSCLLVNSLAVVGLELPGACSGSGLLGGQMLTSLMLGIRALVPGM